MACAPVCSRLPEAAAVAEDVQEVLSRSVKLLLCFLQVVEDYLNDPLNTVGNVPARTGAQLLRAFTKLRPKYKQFTLPIYAAHGDTVSAA
eukprot:scaffold187595_cov18-Tisochrysis_lutea.AAC.2